MITLYDVQQILLSERIENYQIHSTGKIVEEGLFLGDLNSLISFIIKQNIPFAAYYEHTSSPNDYLITEDTLKLLPRGIPGEFIDEIGKYIDTYNSKVLTLNYDCPEYILIACIYEGHYFYSVVENTFCIDGKEITSPQMALQAIIDNHKNALKTARKNYTETIEKLKDELSDIVLSDPTFREQTNKHMRRNYMIDLLSNRLDRHFAPLKELWYSAELHSVFQEAIDFVELLWRKIKFNR